MNEYLSQKSGFFNNNNNNNNNATKNDYGGHLFSKIETTNNHVF
jgi:hypothetical protein